MSGIGFLSNFSILQRRVRTTWPAFLAQFGKVRVPTGEGDTIEKALAAVFQALTFAVAGDTGNGSSAGGLAKNSRPSPGAFSTVCEWDIFSNLPTCRESGSRLEPSSGVQHQSRPSAAWGGRNYSPGRRTPNRGKSFTVSVSLVADGERCAAGRRSRRR